MTLARPFVVRHNYHSRNFNLTYKTLGVACMLIVSILQYVKIGDLTQYDAPPVIGIASSSANVDPDLPPGPFMPMGAEEEDSLTRQSTGAFSG